MADFLTVLVNNHPRRHLNLNYGGAGIVGSQKPTVNQLLRASLTDARVVRDVHLPAAILHTMNMPPKCSEDVQIHALSASRKARPMRVYVPRIVPTWHLTDALLVTSVVP